MGVTVIERDVDDAIESARAFLGPDAAGRTPAELAAIGPAVEPPKTKKGRRAPAGTALGGAQGRAAIYGQPAARKSESDNAVPPPRPDWMADPALLPKRPPGR